MTTAPGYSPDTDGLMADVSQMDLHSIHKPPGNAVFIVNVSPRLLTGTFEFFKRPGAEKDLQHLRDIFIDTLDFRWIIKDFSQDLTRDQWDHKYSQGPTNARDPSTCCVRCRILATDHSDSRYFVLAFSSHGKEKNGQLHVFFSDGHSVTMEEIMEVLSDRNCPTLAGKPRILVLQICRSNLDKPENLDDKGVDLEVMVPNLSAPELIGPNSTQCDANVNIDDDDGPKKSRFTVTRVPPEPVYLGLPEKNVIIVYATTPGRRSRRNTDTGSWMLHEMANVARSYDFDQGNLNFFSLLTKTAGLVSKRETIVYKKDAGGNQIKDDKGDLVVDEEKSRLKSAMCISHRLVDDIVFHKPLRGLRQPQSLFGDN